MNPQRKKVGDLFCQFKIISYICIVKETIKHDDESSTAFVFTYHDGSYSKLEVGSKTSPSTKWLGLVKDETRPKRLLLVRNAVKFRLHVNLTGHSASKKYDIYLTVLCNNPLKAVKGRLNPKQFFVDNISRIESIASRLRDKYGGKVPYDELKKELNALVAIDDLFVAYLQVTEAIQPVGISPSRRRHIS